jgi:cholesterol oxidase
MTAHVLGGAVMASDAAKGVIDDRLRVFGYENLVVCDAAALPANPGVNPALTITALAEYAMSQIPAPAGDWKHRGPRLSRGPPCRTLSLSST